jgi:RNA polymerase sigma-70 factor (ECF subfamily)
VDRDHPTDAERFSALWERHAGRVQAYAMRHVERETAQEVVAETFLVAWRRLEDVPGEALPWLLVVARNTVRNHSRSVYRARRLHAALAALAPAGPTDPANAVHERQMLLRALAAMAASDREAILLVAWDGLASEQAAAVLGCTEAAFKMRLSRARRRLAGAVEERPARTVTEPSGSPA